MYYNRFKSLNIWIHNIVSKIEISVLSLLDESSLNLLHVKVWGGKGGVGGGGYRSTTVYCIFGPTHPNNATIFSSAALINHLMGVIFTIQSYCIGHLKLPTSKTFFFVFVSHDGKYGFRAFPQFQQEYWPRHADSYISSLSQQHPIVSWRIISSALVL